MAKDKIKLPHYCYLITNQINDKVYVGVTHKNINDRFAEHIKVSKFKNDTNKQAIHLAISKYGANNFNISILEIFDNAVDAYAKEIIHIKKLNSTNKKCGYNQSTGGDRGPIKIKYDKKLIISIITDLCNGILLKDLAIKYNMKYHAIFDISRLKISSSIQLPTDLLLKLSDFKQQSNKRKRTNRDQIINIISDFLNDFTIDKLSQKHELSTNNIWNILHRNIWKDVDISKTTEDQLKNKLSSVKYWKK